MTRKEEYHQYLLSPQWVEKKRKAVERYGRKCMRCSREHKLQVHHKKYPDVFGTEPVTDLEILCIWCHAEEHRERALNGESEEMFLAVLPDWFREPKADPEWACEFCGRVHSPNFICEARVNGEKKFERQSHAKMTSLRDIMLGTITANVKDTKRT